MPKQAKQICYHISFELFGSHKNPQQLKFSLPLMSAASQIGPNLVFKGALLANGRERLNGLNKEQMIES